MPLSDEEIKKQIEKLEKQIEKESMKLRNMDMNQTTQRARAKQRAKLNSACEVRDWYLKKLF